MKKVLATAAFFGFLATPAMSQSYNNRVYPGGDIPTAPYTYAPIMEGHGTFARSVKPSSGESNVVRDPQGKVIGVDPDINVRGYLLRNNNVY